MRPLPRGQRLRDFWPADQHAGSKAGRLAALRVSQEAPAAGATLRRQDAGLPAAGLNAWHSAMGTASLHAAALRPCPRLLLVALVGRGQSLSNFPTKSSCDLLGFFILSHLNGFAHTHYK